jgi:molecular chaperone GrpE
VDSDNDDTTEGDELFSIAIDDTILSEALASVEKRMGRSLRQAEMDIGPLDLDALAAVEQELSIEVEDADEAGPEVSAVNATTSVEARLRAMEAEEEAEALRGKLEGLSENRDKIEEHLRSLSNKAQKASEAQRLAELRSRNLKDALEKQQKDVDRLLERRQREKSEEYSRGRADAVTAMAEVIDNLFLALSHDEGDPERLIEGIRICLGQFRVNLAHVGVKTIIPKVGQPFNPEWHEAIASESVPDIAAGHIVSIVSRGYLADGKLIQAARVCVSNG